MGKQTETGIGWCDYTFNPWIGCQKVSPACDHCYAERLNLRVGQNNWGPGAERRRTSEANWRQTLAWDKAAQKSGTSPRVFCGSMCDIFDNAVPAEWRYDLFNLILSTPHLDWLLLTKRIGNAAQMIEATLPDNLKALPPDHPIGWPWANVWLGITVCNQEEADRDIPKLLDVPAAKRFLSVEPMLGEICLGEHGLHGGPGQLDWVICGGESGPNARPMHPHWPMRLRNDCAAAGVPFWFKQWGEWMPVERTPERNAKIKAPGQNYDLWAFPDGTKDGWRTGLIAARVGKKAAGRLLDEREHNGVPT